MEGKDLILRVPHIQQTFISYGQCRLPRHLVFTL